MGRYFRMKPLSRGDNIALLMENRIEYVGIWLGLSKVGFVTALINTNLRHDALLHSIKVANCKVIIFGSELKDGKRILIRLIDDYRCPENRRKEQC